MNTTVDLQGKMIKATWAMTMQSSLKDQKEHCSPLTLIKKVSLKEYVPK